MSCTRRPRGFTLVEVLVALAIVTLGASALLVSLTSAADASSRLRDRQFAEWIAQNRLVEMRLRTAPIEDGDSSGELEYARGRWRWEQRIRAASLPNLREVIVRVSPAERDEWLELRGYLGERIARPADRDRLWDNVRGETP